LPVLLALCLLPSKARAVEDTEKSEACAPCWFSALGISLRGGYSFQETALGREWFGGGLLGPELLGETFVYDFHRVVICIGYSKLYSFQEKGSSQLRRSAEYQRVDWTAGYDIRWKLLVAGLRVGAAASIVTTRTALGEPGWYVEDEEIFFTPPEDPEVSEHTGATLGFLAGLGIGIALGEPFFGIEDLVEIRVWSEYLRRGERDDFTVYGALVFWPTRLF
jgi:hypothetical protein